MNQSFVFSLSALENALEINNNRGVYSPYRNSHELVSGCQHYCKRICKLVASSCNKLYNFLAEIVSKYLPRRLNADDSVSSKYYMIIHETKSSKDQTNHHCKVCSELDRSNTEKITNLVLLSQEKLEAAIRRVSVDQTLMEPKTKSIIIQNLLMRLTLLLIYSLFCFCTNF